LAAALLPRGASAPSQHAAENQSSPVGGRATVTRMKTPPLNCAASMKGGFALRAASAWPQSRRPSISACICRACWRQRLRTVTFTGPRAANDALYRTGSFTVAPRQHCRRPRPAHNAPGTILARLLVGIERSGPARLLNFSKKNFRNLPQKNAEPKTRVFVFVQKIQAPGTWLKDVLAILHEETPSSASVKPA
jgi:hypothetical protein